MDLLRVPGKQPKQLFSSTKSIQDLPNKTSEFLIHQTISGRWTFPGPWCFQPARLNGAESRHPQRCDNLLEIDASWKPSVSQNLRSFFFAAGKREKKTHFPTSWRRVNKNLIVGNESGCHFKKVLDHVGGYLSFQSLGQRLDMFYIYNMWKNADICVHIEIHMHIAWHTLYKSSLYTNRLLKMLIHSESK